MPSPTPSYRSSLGFVLVEVLLVDVPVVVIARAAAARHAATPTSASYLPRRQLLRECRSNRRANLRAGTYTLLISSSQQQFVDLGSDSVATGRCIGLASRHGRERRECRVADPSSDQPPQAPQVPGLHQFHESPDPPGQHLLSVSWLPLGSWVGPANLCSLVDL
jgi:hypothetical protein